MTESSWRQQQIVMQTSIPFAGGVACISKQQVQTQLRFVVSLMLHAIICPWRVTWLHGCMW